MSDAVTQNAMVNNLGDRAQSVLAYLSQLPLSFWRNLALAIAAIWIVRSAAALFWLIFPVPEAAQPAKLALPVETQAKRQTTSVSYDSLASFKDVFGKYDATQVAAAPTPPPLAQGDATVETKLKLKLHGIFAMSDRSKGSAIIGEGSKQTLYSVNEEIEGNRGVKLAQVWDKKVVLDNKGRLENLYLYSEEDFKASLKSSSSSRTEPRRTASNRQSTPENSIRTTARPDQVPKNIGDVVRFSVHREEGKMVGYRIRPGRDRELFNQVGLKANDIVTSVNGIEVNDPKQIRSVYKSMKTATEAQLSVLRNGESHSITISLDSGA